jgi:DNA invertase Pin-like site-specific DNA recombinase
MAFIGYGRVSTRDQDAALQRTALTDAGCSKVFEETGSGKTTEGREQFAALLDYAREGDVIVVWKVDRFARSVIDLILTVDDLQKRGIGFKVLTGALSNVDTTTPDGRLFLTMVGGFAEFERSLIVERTRAGLAAAKAEGRVGGRPKAIDDDKAAAIRARRDKGESPRAIAQALGVGKSTVYRLLAEDEALAA